MILDRRTASFPGKSTEQGGAGVQSFYLHHLLGVNPESICSGDSREIRVGGAVGLAQSRASWNTQTPPGAPPCLGTSEWTQPWEWPRWADLPASAQPPHTGPSAASQPCSAHLSRNAEDQMSLTHPHLFFWKRAFQRRPWGRWWQNPNTASPVGEVRSSHLRNGLCGVGQEPSVHFLITTSPQGLNSNLVFLLKSLFKKPGESHPYKP